MTNFESGLHFAFLHCCCVHSYPFRFHTLGHKVIHVHSSHPRADGGAGFGNLGDGGRLELLVIYVGLDCTDDVVWDIVLQRIMKAENTTLIHHAVSRHHRPDT